jgi:hypothetical protein
MNRRLPFNECAQTELLGNQIQTAQLFPAAQSAEAENNNF